MTTHDCHEFQDRLTSYLVDDVAPPHDMIVFARTCSACAAILRDLADSIEVESVLEPSPQVAERAIARGSRWARRVYAVGKLIKISISLALVTLWFLYVELGFRSAVGFQLHRVGEEPRLIVVTCTVIAVGYLSLIGWSRRGERSKLYARWAGRQLQGICVGTAGFFGVPVWSIRIAFLALFFAGLGGGTIYILLAFLVDWHPDDRQHMTGFRIERWWRRRLSSSART